MVPPVQPDNSIRRRKQAKSRRARLRRANQRMRQALRRYRWGMLALGAGLLVVLSLAFFRSDDPDAVLLGRGQAGVISPDSNTVAVNDAPPAERALGDGEASYYANSLRGRPTASGELYDPDRLTAAHRTLPLGSRVRVTNLRNERSVVVTITDRGPYHGNRVIDLSRAAADRLNMLSSGVARVRLHLLDD